MSPTLETTWREKKAFLDHCGTHDITSEVAVQSCQRTYDDRCARVVVNPELLDSLTGVVVDTLAIESWDNIKKPRYGDCKMLLSSVLSMLLRHCDVVMLSCFNSRIFGSRKSREH